ncbi:unnamed protein product [Protopolystoma xenopodis]|uniref:Uncharacterized protein n=1 Tax=Protopolystoma xenopodis TaxID=117903 RepID=A0A3S5CJ59_9PLAT|nr:unnamed protein product [Protopolystoma xenopodis]
MPKARFSPSYSSLARSPRISHAKQTDSVETDRSTPRSAASTGEAENRYRSNSQALKVISCQRWVGIELCVWVFYTKGVD